MKRTRPYFLAGIALVVLGALLGASGTLVALVGGGPISMAGGIVLRVEPMMWTSFGCFFLAAAVFAGGLATPSR
ncbi:hypothetical protein OV203_34220 [Nannocystis sp. ILAH1]|uniref:hypothetical protein n=1 Tax=unclassified Nannocystis TaxID=2627009 RepID=UPI00226D6622|nr:MULTISPECIES: hypothetical protein [unclassified Nannocystis]MCY0992244.1 hypothetical protein [Nannocystis sp. ILAH1]MCY1069168.1 hypothetical protein [Nannocystis sp. RBIL2]